jgi:hypothetical protein
VSGTVRVLAALGGHVGLANRRRLLHQYKSTCSTSAKVQILTSRAVRPPAAVVK